MKYSVQLALLFSLILLRICGSTSQICPHYWKEIGAKLRSPEVAISFFKNLLSPIEYSLFVQKYYGVKTTAIRGRETEFYRALILIDQVETLFASYLDHFVSKRNFSGTPEIQRWRLVKRATKNDSWFTSSIDLTKINSDIAYAFYETGGHSIILNQAEGQFASLKYATSLLEGIFGARVQANLYLTPDNHNQAFEVHFDWMDALVAQISGCKRWKVYRVPTVKNPLPDTVVRPKQADVLDYACSRTNNNTHDSTCEESLQRPPNNADDGEEMEYDEFDLPAGSLLYIPRGYAHEASTDCAPSDKDIAMDAAARTERDHSEREPSLHVTFGIETATHYTVEIFLHHYLDAYFQKMAETESEDSCSRLHECDLNSINCSHNGEKCLPNTLHSDCNKIDSTTASDTTVGTMAEQVLILKSRPVIDTSNGSQQPPFPLRVALIGFSRLDLLHLALHVLATTGAMPSTTTVNYGDAERKNMAESIPEASALLRQSVALMSALVKNGWKPTIDTSILKALEALPVLLSAIGDSTLIVDAIILALNMGVLRVKTAALNDINGHNDTVGDNPTSDFRDSKSKSLYIARFLSHLQATVAVSVPISHNCDFPSTVDNASASNSDHKECCGHTGDTQRASCTVDREYNVDDGVDEGDYCSCDRSVAFASQFAEKVNNISTTEDLISLLISGNWSWSAAVRNSTRKQPLYAAGEHQPITTNNHDTGTPGVSVELNDTTGTKAHDKEVQSECYNYSPQNCHELSHQSRCRSLKQDLMNIFIPLKEKLREWKSSSKKDAKQDKKKWEKEGHRVHSNGNGSDSDDDVIVNIYCDALKRMMKDIKLFKTRKM